MIPGILAGFAAALFQSLSYVASRSFMNRHNSSVKLTILSLMASSVPAFLLLLVLHGRYTIPVSDWKAWCYLAGGITSLYLGQFSLFLANRHVEASRLSSLLGVKIIFLALFCALFMGQTITGLQWLGILLCSIAAVGMNYSGLRISMKALLYLAMTLTGYIGSDLCIAEFVKCTSAENEFIRALAAVSMEYALAGLLPVGLLFKIRCSPREFIAASPFGLIWFAAMLVLFYSFTTIGVVYGSVLQAFRGIFSVIIGILLIRLHVFGHEPAVSRKDWFRRFIMAALMLLALMCYSFGRN